MLNKDTISIHLVREALLQSCTATGGMHDVLQKVGIDPALLDEPQARVPAIAYARMWRLLARRLDDEFFGMDPRKLRAGSLSSCVARPWRSPRSRRAWSWCWGFCR